MKTILATITCLLALGPAMTLAHEGHYERIVVKEHYSHPHHKAMWKKSARGKHPPGHHYRGKRSYRDEVVYGRVLSAEPIYRHTTLRRDSCVRYNDNEPRRDSYTPTLLGAIIGGAVGHRIGDNHGDAGAAAIAGGLLGASIGRDVGRHAERGRRVVVDGPCGYGGDHAGREVVEYAVRYRYNGQVYHTRMDHDPGEWIALDVEPV